MDSRELLDYTIKMLNKKGIDRVQCMLDCNDVYEFTIEKDSINLLRTTHDNVLNIKAIKDNKPGQITISNSNKNEIDGRIDNLVEIISASPRNVFNDIAEKQEKQVFQDGTSEPDIDMMYTGLSEFLSEIKSSFSSILLRNTIYRHTSNTRLVINTSGLDLIAYNNIYLFGTMFTAKKGKETSSFNYTAYLLNDPSRKIIDLGNFKNQLSQSCEQTETSKLEKKFEGKILATPDCLALLLEFLVMYLRDQFMLSKSSIFQDKLDLKVADNVFTLHSNTVTEELASKEFITNDGYAAKNMTIIDKGILKSFLLSQFGANSLGKQRALNDGTHLMVDPGNKSYDDMIKDVDRGILLCRLSAGCPNANGDFSGVAKNSYFIENGKIKYPLTETMISGNINDMFNSDIEITKERINFGYGIFPWILFNEVTISG